jgi:hypothetical protein
VSWKQFLGPLICVLAIVCVPEQTTVPHELLMTLLYMSFGYSVAMGSLPFDTVPLAVVVSLRALPCARALITFSGFNDPKNNDALRSEWQKLLVVVAAHAILSFLTRVIIAFLLICPVRSYFEATFPFISFDRGLHLVALLEMHQAAPELFDCVHDGLSRMCELKSWNLQPVQPK